MPDSPRRAAGVLAVFGERDCLLEAIGRAKAEGLLRLTAYAPAYDRELVEAASTPPVIGIGPFAAVAGALGFVAALAVAIWMTLHWPELIVGGKPLVALPPFLVIAVVTLILFASCATIGLFVLRSIGARPPAGAPYDPRFSDGAFGLWIQCPSSRVAAVSGVMRHLGAIECRVV